MMAATVGAPPPPEPPRLLTAQQAAEYLGVSVTWLYRQIGLGQAAKKPLPVRHVGRLVRFRQAELDLWLNED